MFRKYRWCVLILLFCASFINYIDRAALSIVAPMISKEFSLNAADMGLVFSSFFIGYALFNFVGGYLSDIYGPKKIFSVSMVTWSIFGGVTGASFNYISLFLSRIFFGLAEGPIGSGTNKTINNWFPAGERARSVGLAIAAMPCGAALSGPIVGMIAFHFGWRAPFFILMILGLVWYLFWSRLMTDYPRENSRVSKEEVLEIEQDQQILQNESVKYPISFYIKQPTILAIALCFFACNYVLYFFLTWFPSYLVTAHNLSLKDMSIVTVIPWLLGVIGQVSGGFISDAVYRKTGKLMFARKAVLVPSLAICAISVGVGGWATTTISAVVLMSIGMFCQYLTASNIWAVVQDAVPSNSVGGVGGLVHFLSNLAGILGPAATGFIVQYTGNFTSAFVLAGVLAIAGAVAMAFLVSPINADKQSSAQTVV